MNSLKQILTALFFAWRYRRPIFAVVSEVELIQRHYNTLAGATTAKEAQRTMVAVLELRSLREIVAATKTNVDDEWLAKLKMFVADDDIFNVAWKVLHGNWNINIDFGRQNGFIRRIRSILPFARPNLLAIQGAHDESMPFEVREDTDEAGVVEVVNLLMLFITIAPKIKAILAYRLPT